MKDAGQTSRQKHLPFRLTAEDDVDNKGSGCHHDSTSDGDGVSGDVNVGNVAKMKEKETECAITKTVNDDDDEEPEATDVKQSVTIDNDDEYLSLKLTSVRNIVHDHFKYGIQKRDEGISAHEVQTDATASSTTPSPSDTDTDTDTNTSTDTDTGPGAGAGSGDEKSPEEEKHELDIAFGALRVLNAQFDIDRHTSRAVANNTVLVEACGAFSQLLSTQFRTNTFTYRIRVENIGAWRGGGGQ